MLAKAELKRFRAAISRHGRKRSGLSVCEGPRPCLELVRARPDWIRLAVVSDSVPLSEAVQSCLEALEEQGLSPRYTEPSQFESLALTPHPQGMAILFEPEVRKAESAGVGADPFALVLDRVSDPGNLGTILRTAWAAGLRSVWLTPGTADPFAPRTVRAGMGAQFGLDVVMSPDLEELWDMLSAKGLKDCWLADSRGGISCFEPEFELPGAALVIGNEAHGCAQLPGARSVSIPMPGPADSLNVAQAATVLLLEAVRRGTPGGAAH